MSGERWRREGRDREKKKDTDQVLPASFDLSSHINLFLKNNNKELVILELWFRIYSFSRPMESSESLLENKWLKKSKNSKYINI